MIEDAPRRAAADGDDRWIESLGLTAEEEELIQHSLDVADELIHRTESVRTAAPSPSRGGLGASGSGEDRFNREPGRVREDPEPVVPAAEPPLQPPTV
jgi:hypothetical protein